MTWGLGTGHCGSHLLAKNLGGLHQPEPWILEEATKFWQNMWVPALAKLLDQKRDLDTQIVVDHKYSMVIPKILVVDPDPHFIWLIRDPADTIRSDIRAHLYDRDPPDQWVKNRLQPEEGFPTYFNELDKCIWRYWQINHTIERQLIFVCRSRWEMQRAEDLDGWVKPEHDDPFGVGDLSLVERQLRPQYVEWINKYGT